MVTTSNINVHELLQIADAVAREKLLDRMIVIEALEEAIAKSAKQKYGLEYDIRTKIEPKTGRIIVKRYRKIIDEIFEEEEFPAYYITKQDAEELNYEITSLEDEYSETGTSDFIIEELPSVDIGRISAQSARQVIVQKIRQAERESQFEAFKDRVGEVIHGTVKRVEFGNVMVSLGDHGEGMVRRNDVIPRENVRVGDRIRCYIYDVRRENSGTQIFLSRTHPQFLARLFAAEVPEIYDGVIEIKSVARDPGSRAKIAVFTDDPSLDPVGSCVGVRGTRVQAVTNELQGERIDIIQWSPDAATFIMNVLNPIPVLRVVVDDENDKVEVVVPDDSLSQVIGRQGQNVRLLSHLLGWDVEITTETNDSEKRQNEFSERTEMFVRELDVDTLLAQFLVSEGFLNVEDIAYIDLDELQSIEGIDDGIAEALQERAFVAIDNKKLLQLDKMGVSIALREMRGLTVDMLLTLAKSDIRSLSDFAGLTSDELILLSDVTEDVATDQASDEEGISTEAAPEEETPILMDYDLSEDQVNKMIMAARTALGWLDD